MENTLNKRWEDFNTEKFVDGVFGEVDEKVNKEARELMEDTIKERKDVNGWG